MKFKREQPKIPQALPLMQMAKVPHMFDNVRVIVGSDEDIFEETFLTAIVGDNRMVKLKKSALEYV
jgi:hypothetical protein